MHQGAGEVSVVETEEDEVDLVEDEEVSVLQEVHREAGVLLVVEVDTREAASCDVHLSLVRFSPSCICCAQWTGRD